MRKPVVKLKINAESTLKPFILNAEPMLKPFILNAEPTSVSVL